MHYARFTTRIDESTTRCEACLWRCELQAGTWGQCQMREGRPEGIAFHNAGLISAAEVTPIEHFRLWHFFPDTIALSIGGWGYAFPFDQRRGKYGSLPADDAERRELPAEKAASFALKQLCRGVIWAYSEPAVAAEYVRDVIQASRAASRYTALHTTGYLTRDTIDQFGPYLDGISLDLRGFGDAAYARLGGIPDWQAILDAMVYARHHWHCHIEITTRIHRGVNDRPEELDAMIAWIRESLDPQTPWHVLPGDRGAESAAAVVRARRMALEQGLYYVYGPETNQATQCPQCQSLLITRDKGVSSLVGIQDGQCSTCGFTPYLRTSIFKTRKGRDDTREEPE